MDGEGRNFGRSKEVDPEKNGQSDGAGEDEEVEYHEDDSDGVTGLLGGGFAVGRSAR